MKVDEAEIVLTWSNGRTVKIGTITIETDRDGARAKVSRFKQRFGWELVRKGMAIMLPGRKWMEKWDESASC